MNSKDSHFNRRLALLIVLSLIVFTCTVVLRVGIEATPYDTTDSLGRPMGFNDPLHLEHYLIMIGNFAPVELLKPEYAYEWVLFVAQLTGAGMLLSSRTVNSRVARWYFVVQAVMFPFALPAIFLLPPLVYSLLTSHLDRESFIDMPFFIATAQPAWVVTSLFIALAFRGAGLLGNGRRSALSPSSA